MSKKFMVKLNPYYQIIVFFLLIALFLFISGFIVSYFGVSNIKMNQLISSFFLMLVVPFLFLLIFKPTYPSQSYIKIASFRLKDYTYLILLMLLSIPFLTWLGEWNTTFPVSVFGDFGATLSNLHEQYMLSVKEISRLGSLYEAIATFLIIVIIPAIGEELFFRAVLQNIIIRMTKRVGLAIIITSIIFSVLHFDIYGFMPRFLISCLLGYLYFKTNNLLMSITWHLLNNAILLITIWINQEAMEWMFFSDLSLLLTILIVTISLTLSSFVLRKWLIVN